MLYNFMTRRGTDAIFFEKQLQEKYLATSKMFFLTIANLEKVIDKVPSSLIWLLSVDEWFVKSVQVMYKDAVSKIRVNNNFSNEFRGMIGIYHSSISVFSYSSQSMRTSQRNLRLDIQQKLYLLIIHFS